MGGLLKHKFLHDGDLLLKFTLLLCHELLDLIDHLGVPLAQLENVSDVQLVNDGTALLLLVPKLLRSGRR